MPKKTESTKKESTKSEQLKALINREAQGLFTRRSYGSIEAPKVAQLVEKILKITK